MLDPDQAADDGHLADAQDQAREGQIAQPLRRPEGAAPAGDGEDAPVHRQKQHRHDGDPEPGHRYPEEGEKG